MLGGSFNPAHAGHRHISLEALRRLRLDYVWWLVSPQNPLKSTRDMAALPARLEAAKKVANHPRIRVLDLESRLGTRYTADSLTKLCKLLPQSRFVWLMGADNMAQLPHWWHWRRILETLPIAVFDRPHYSIEAGLGKAAGIYRRRRVPEARARKLATIAAPAWTFIHIPRNPLSATRIRAGKQTEK